jgi:hypothetical protein
LQPNHKTKTQLFIYRPQEHRVNTGGRQETGQEPNAYFFLKNVKNSPELIRICAKVLIFVCKKVSTCEKDAIYHTRSCPIIDSMYDW